MSERLVHLIDSDNALAAQVAATLHGNGLRVTVFADGNDALNASETPSLVILCIDPKRFGWALCKRIRNSGPLKNVPLIVTSAEATQKDFDDHRALKNHADDYLHKPFPIEALVEKVANLLGGFEPSLDAIEIPIGDEIAIEDDLAVEVEMDESTSSPTRPAARPDSGARPPVAVATAPDRPSDMPELPEVMNADETEAAFDAISVSVPMPQPPLRPPAPPHAATREDATAVQPMPNEPTPTPTPAPLSPVPPGPPPRSAPTDLGLDEPLARAASRPEPPRNEFSREREGSSYSTFSREREGGSVSTFSREREFLNLREVINKKEKELLDLRDSIDAKDRQVLDLRDKIREAERARRDQDEKLLALEREAVAAREKGAGLARDKEIALQRETGLKHRLEEAQKKVDRAEAEIDEWKNRHREDLDAAISAAAAAQSRSESELAALKVDYAARTNESEKTVRELKQKLAAEQAQTQALKLLSMESEERNAAALSNLQRKHDHASAERDRNHADELQKVRAAQAEMMAVAEQRGRDQLAAAEERHRADLGLLSQTHGDEQFRLEADHKRALEQLSADHARELSGLRQERAAAEHTLLDERARVAQLVGEIDRLRAEHEDRIAQLSKKHAAAVDDLNEKMAEAEARHEFDKEEMGSRQQAMVREYAEKYASEMQKEKDVLAARGKSLAEELAEKTREIESSKAQITGLLADLTTSNTRINEIERRHVEREARIADLERESQRLQEQVLGAVQRMKTDEVTVARAKKALAIALTLLDGERGGGGS